MLRVFAIRDVKADAFEEMLVVCPTQGIAKRVFVDGVAQKGSRLSRYAEDFSLMEVGEFDQSSGQISGHKVPVLVMTAVAAKEVAEAEAKKATQPVPTDVGEEGR